MIYEITNIGRKPVNTPDDEKRIGRMVIPSLQTGFPGWLFFAEDTEKFTITSAVKSIKVVGDKLYFETRNTEYTLTARGM